jgi:hypothetical protein
MTCSQPDLRPCPNERVNDFADFFHPEVISQTHHLTWSLVGLVPCAQPTRSRYAIVSGLAVPGALCEVDARATAP